MKRLTRAEIWTAICSKYKNLKHLSINSSYNGGTHIKREVLVNLMIEMRIHTSNHLTKEQRTRFNMKDIVDKL